jgi:nitroimidazol reductase NimA-like FMN-containing flavoprotein (pyridoxamine 5'-phosphate oxidase superfamily)
MTSPTDPVLDHAGLEILTIEECRSLLASTAVGRIAFLDRGDPTILPITIGMWDGAVVFTTAPGSKLQAAIMNEPVAIEVDDWDATTHTGWSVLVKGMATVVDDGREIDSLDRLSVKSWSRPDVPKAWVRIVGNEITGRRVVALGSSD